MSDNKQMSNKKITHIRVNKELLNELDELKQPIKKKFNHNRESYADVIQRLLNKHKAEMLGDVREYG